MHLQKRFHLVFSMVMGALMIFVMTFVITLVNVGWSARFLEAWAKAFGIAYVVGVPVIFSSPLSHASSQASCWASIRHDAIN